MSVLTPELADLMASGQPAQLRAALACLQLHQDLAEPLDGIPAVDVSTFAPALRLLDMEEFRTFLIFLLGQASDAPALPRELALEQLAACVVHDFNNELIRRLHLIEDMDDSIALLSGLARRLGSHLTQVSEARALWVKGWLWLYLDRDGPLADAMAEAVTGWADGPNITVVLRHLAWDLTRGRHPHLESRAGTRGGDGAA